VVLQQRISRLEQEVAAARVGDKQGELHAQQAKELREQWKQVREERAAIEEAGPTAPAMSRGHQALIVLSCFALLTAIGVAASWMAANRFLPATVTASVDLDAQGPRGERVEGEAAVTWESWHRETLADAAFHGKVATRLVDLQMDGLTDVKKLGTRIHEDLTIDSPRPGALRLTLAGTNPDTLTTLLDTVATTLTRESSQSVNTRPDGAVAVIPGARTGSARASYVTLNVTPVMDHRFAAGCFFFVTGAVVCLCVFRWIHGMLARTKAAMADEDFELVAANVS
jgi:hypothetical protein